MKIIEHVLNSKILMVVEDVKWDFIDTKVWIKTGITISALTESGAVNKFFFAIAKSGQFMFLPSKGLINTVYFDRDIIRLRGTEFNDEVRKITSLSLPGDLLRVILLRLVETAITVPSLSEAEKMDFINNAHRNLPSTFDEVVDAVHSNLSGSFEFEKIDPSEERKDMVTGRLSTTDKEEPEADRSSVNYNGIKAAFGSVQLRNPNVVSSDSDSIRSAAPRGILRGVKDESDRSPVHDPEMIPTHLPQTHLFAEKGPTVSSNSDFDGDHDTPNFNRRSKMQNEDQKKVMDKPFGEVSVTDMITGYCDSNLKVTIKMSCQRSVSDLNDQEMEELIVIKLKPLKKMTPLDFERYRELTGIVIEFKTAPDGCGCVECK